MLKIEYVPLSELKEWPTNPKEHDLGELHLSVSRFGFVTPFVLDDRTGSLAEGAGRMQTLLQKKHNGEKPPKNVTIKDGEWLVPVVTGNEFNSDTELESFIIAANQLTFAGGWDEFKLVDLLQKIVDERGDEGLSGVGFDTDDLDAMLRRLDPLPQDDFVDSESYGDISANFEISFIVHGPDERDQVVEELKSRGYDVQVRLARE